jgi:hypothetical protein
MTEHITPSWALDEPAARAKELAEINDEIAGTNVEIARVGAELKAISRNCSDARDSELCNLIGGLDVIREAIEENAPFETPVSIEAAVEILKRAIAYFDDLRLDDDRQLVRLFNDRKRLLRHRDALEDDALELDGGAHGRT